MVSTNQLRVYVAPGRKEEKWALGASLLGALRKLGAQVFALPARYSKGFGSLPEGLKKVVTMEYSDVILYDGEEDRALLTIELTTHNPMGMNSFQRLARLASSATAGVPTMVCAPCRKWVTRQEGQDGWEELNPLFFSFLKRVRTVTGTPVLYLDSPADDLVAPEELVGVLNAVVANWISGQPTAGLYQSPVVAELIRQVDDLAMDDPQVASNHVEVVKSASFLGLAPAAFAQRPESVILTTHSRTFRADPYAGWVAAHDWLFCRGLATDPAERRRNLVICFPDADPEVARKKLLSGTTKEFRLLYSVADLLCVGDEQWYPALGEFPASVAAGLKLPS